MGPLLRLLSFSNPCSQLNSHMVAKILSILVLWGLVQRRGRDPRSLKVRGTRGEAGDPRILKCFAVAGDRWNYRLPFLAMIVGNTIVGLLQYSKLSTGNLQRMKAHSKSLPFSPQLLNVSEWPMGLTMSFPKRAGASGLHAPQSTVRCGSQLAG